MSLEASSLQVIVSGNGIEATTKQLEALAAAGDKAEQSATKLAKTSKDSSKAQVDAAQEAASKYNAIIDMMTEKSSTYYADKALKAAQAAQQELFDGMAMMDKLYAASQAFHEKESADRAQQTADVLAQQQKQMDAVMARYAAEQELANRMNAAYDKRQSASIEDAHAAAIIEDKKRAWQALGQVQAEAIRINRDLDAAQKALENDHSAAIIEDKKRAWKALGQSQMEASAINAKIDADAKALKADGDAFVAMLKRQAETVGMTTKELKEYNAEQLRAKAAQLGVSQQVEGYVTAIKNAKGPHESFNLLTAGSARELMVLGHELSQGNFQRFGGSLIVLGERINFLPWLLENINKAASALGMSLGVFVGTIAAVVAGVVAATMTFIHSTTSLKEMRNEVILTGHSIGATGDDLYDMANKVGDAIGKFGVAREAVVKLASTGKFTADQIGLITEAAVGLEKYGGVSIDTVIKQFEKLAAEPIHSTMRGFKGVSEGAMELDKQLHYLNPQMLEEIVHLERIGDVSGASKLAIEGLAGEEKKRIAELKANLTPLGEFFEEVGAKASKMWNHLFHKESLGEQLSDAKDQLNYIQKYSTYASPQEKAAAELAAKQTIANLEKQLSDKQERERAEAHKKEIDRAAELALMHRRATLDMAKNEDALTAATARDAEDRAAIKAAGLKSELFTAEADADAMAAIQKRYTQKVAATPGLGMSKVNSRIAELQMEFEKASYFADKEIKIEQDKVKHHEESVQKLYEDQQKYFAIRSKLIDDTEAKELAATNLYDHNAKNSAKLAEEAETKKFEIQKRYQTLRDKLAADKEAADVALNRANGRGENSQEAQFVKETKAINEKTLALQHQIDGYNLIDEATRKAGLSEKQMRDYFTQAEIEGVQQQIEALQQFDGVDIKLTASEIARLKARKTALEDLRKAQQGWEGIQTKNQAALNTPAALKAAATANVKLWKEAGNEIEKSLTQAFGNAGQAAGKMFKAFAEGQASQIDIAQKIKEAQDRQNKDGIDQTKLINDLQLQGAQVQLASYGNMADAAKGFFKEGSKGYEAMTKAAQVLHAAEVALSLIKAVNAVLTQGEGDPYTAFARMAAMTALVAGLGVALSGGGGGGMSSADRQKTQGTGSVLGSPTHINGNQVELVGAKSESIARSLSIMEKNSGLGLAQGNDMVMYLKNVSDNIANMASLIVRSTGITGNLPASTKGTASTTLMLGGLGSTFEKLLPGWVGKTLGKIGNSIFGGNTSAQDTGFTMQSGSLGSIMQNGVNASQYTDMKKDGGWFHSDKHWTNTTSLGGEANSQFTKIITGMGDTLKAASKALGVDGAAFNAHLNNFVIDLGKISLKGLSGDEIQKQLEAVFSKMGDDMTKWAFVGFDKFQKVGEGMLETIARVANDFMQVKDVFAVLGKTLNLTGASAANVSESLIEAAGGLDTLTKNTKFYVDNFLTEAQKMGPVTDSVRKYMDGLHLSSITTVDQFNKLIRALDLTSPADQKLYAALLQVAPQFKQAADYAQELADGTQTLTKSQQGLLDKVNAARSKLQDSYNAESSALQSTIDKTKAYAVTLKQFQDSLKLGADSPLTNMQKYAEARKQFDATSAAAKGGDETAQGQLTAAASALLSASKVVNASGNAYTSDFNLVQSVLDQMQVSVKGQTDVAQASLDALNKQVTGLIDINKSVLSVADAVKNLESAMILGSSAGISNSQLGITDSQVASIIATGVAQLAQANSASDAEIIALLKQIRDEAANGNDASAQQTGALIQATHEASGNNADATVGGLYAKMRGAIGQSKLALN